MARKPRTITKPDLTGFTKRPRASVVAAPDMATEQAATIKKKPETAEKLSKRTVTKAVGTQKQGEDKHSGITSKETIGAQVGIGLDSKDANYSKIRRICDQYKIEETDIFKIITKRVRALAAQQDDNRKAEKLDPVGEIRYRARIPVPMSYVQSFRDNHDKLELVGLAEIGASWIRPVLDQAINDALHDIHRKLGE